MRFWKWSMPNSELTINFALIILKIIILDNIYMLVWFFSMLSNIYDKENCNTVIKMKKNVLTD